MWGVNKKVTMKSGIKKKKIDILFNNSIALNDLNSTEEPGNSWELQTDFTQNRNLTHCIFVNIIWSLNYLSRPKESFRKKEIKLVMHFRKTQKGTQVLHKKPLLGDQYQKK